MTQATYTDRVLRGEDGVYRWRGKVSMESQKRTIRLVLGIMGGFCLFFLLMALWMDGSMLLPTLLACLGVMAVTGLCCLLLRPRDTAVQPYELTEEHIRYVGTGRSNAYMPYKNIRRVRIRPAACRIDVKGAVVGFPVFVPPEDFVFVRDYIRLRLPSDARVELE